MWTSLMQSCCVPIGPLQRRAMVASVCVAHRGKAVSKYCIYFISYDKLHIDEYLWTSWFSYFLYYIHESCTTSNWHHFLITVRMYVQTYIIYIQEDIFYLTNSNSLWNIIILLISPLYGNVLPKACLVLHLECTWVHLSAAECSRVQHRVGTWRRVQ